MNYKTYMQGQKSRFNSEKRLGASNVSTLFITTYQILFRKFHIYFFTYLCPEVGKFLQYISQNVKNNPKWIELNKEQLNKMNTVRQNYDLNGVNEVSKIKTGQQW